MVKIVSTDSKLQHHIMLLDTLAAMTYTFETMNLRIWMIGSASNASNKSRFIYS